MPTVFHIDGLDCDIVPPAVAVADHSAKPNPNHSRPHLFVTSNVAITFYFFHLVTSLLYILRRLVACGVAS